MGCDRKEDAKETVYYQNVLKGTVLCYDAEFLEIVKEYIPPFFQFHNFGTRQDKGFGSFSVSGENRVESIMDVVRKYMPNAYCLDYREVLKRDRNISAEDRLNDIGIVYGLMKGGSIFLRTRTLLKTSIIKAPYYAIIWKRELRMRKKR